jgi:predicted MFS family arabinose efflux permease
MAGSAISLPAYVRLLRENRNFRRLWLAQIVSEMGDWIYTIAIYTLLLNLTHSAASVALAVVLQVLPQFFVAPTAGVLNDRLSRKRIMIAADLARASIVLGMLFVSRAQMVPLIYLLLLLETMMWAFFEPGRSAVVPNITGGADLVAANTLSSMTWSLNLALGSGIGGAIAAFFGRDTVFVLNSLSFVLSASLIWGMKFPEPHLEGAKPLRARDLVDFSPIAEGVRYVAHERRLFSLMMVKAGLGLLGTHLVLLPLFGERVFSIKSAGAESGGMLGMSVLMSARGVGALLGPVIGGYWTGRAEYRMRMGILAGFLTAAAGYFALATAPSLGIASASVVLANAGTSMVWVFSTTLLQIHTDDRFRGRVFSADFAFLVATMSLASYGAGLLVDWGIGLRTLAMATGVVAFLPLAAWASAQKMWGGPPDRSRITPGPAKG